MAEGLTSLLRVLEGEEEEDRATLKSSSLENQLQPLVVDSSWLPLYKEEVLKEAVDHIVGFVTNPDMGIRQHAEEASKFLNCVCVLCACANALGMMEGMEIFCQGYKVLENIEVVLKEDSSFQLTTEVRHLSMQAITQLSTVGTLLEGKEKILLELCFSSVFWLPPTEHILSPKPTLYYDVLMSMDTLLQQVVANCSESRVSEVLEMIFQLLINFSNCERPEVRKRAVGRIRGLSRFLTASSWGKHDQKTENQEFQIPNFGELLGQLVLLLSFKEKEEETSAMALDALWCFFIEKHQKCTTLPEDQEELRQNWEVQTAAPSCSEVARTVTEMFSGFLKPSERTGFILRVIEGMQSFTIYDKELVGSVLLGITGESVRWIVDIPRVLTSLYQTLCSVRWDSAWQGVRSLLLKLLEQNPEDAVKLLLDTAPPGDRSGLDMWEMLLTKPGAVDLVLVELHKQLQLRHQNLLFSTLSEDISCLALLSTMYLSQEFFAQAYTFWRFLKDQTQDVLSVALVGMATLSETPEMAWKLKVLLPDLLEVLEQEAEDVQLKALKIFRNVLRELSRKEVTAMAPELLDKLLPLFGNEMLSDLREFSLQLFTELLQKVSGRRELKWRRELKQRVRRGLFQLWLHMRDESPSVAQASSQALLAAAELLQWQQLQDLVQTEQTWRIGECLLQQGRSRAEEYLEQSLGYLEDAQDTLRLEAIRFLGLAARGQSHQKLSELISALYPLKHDCIPSIRCLATQTIFTLGSLRAKEKWRKTKRFWCC